MFIAFEGIDGSGKSTQAKLLAKHLGCKLHSEPGSSLNLRDTIMDNNTRTEARFFLFLAERAQLVNEVINPTLALGEDIVLDRYEVSTEVYQPEYLTSKVDVGFVKPDLVIFLDTPGEVASKRLNARKDNDIMDNTDVQYLEGLNTKYKEALPKYPSHVVTIDGTGSTDEVHREIVELVNWLKEK